MEKLSYAILIDGGFVKYALKTSNNPIGGLDVSRLISAVARLPCINEMRLHRVYFYDAKPLTGKFTRPDGQVADFSASKMALISQRQHTEIARLPYVAMRFGELSDRGWRVKERVVRRAATTPILQIESSDLEHNIQQKGVDMRIGLDIAALSLKRHAQLVVLVTGDSDLVPAMKFARREGVQMVLVTLGSHVKEAMRDHADVVVDEPAATLLRTDADPAS